MKFCAKPKIHKFVFNCGWRTIRYNIILKTIASLVYSQMRSKHTMITMLVCDGRIKLLRCYLQRSLRRLVVNKAETDKIDEENNNINI